MKVRAQLDVFDDNDEFGLKCEDESLAKDSFREECDINTIVKRFGLTGQLPSDVRMPTYGDFSNVTDFHSAMNAIVAARESFEAMPAEVRARFGNDPGAFVDFCSDEKNRAEAERLGLVDPAKVKKPDVPAAPPGAGAAAPAPGAASGTST